MKKTAFQLDVSTRRRLSVATAILACLLLGGAVMAGCGSDETGSPGPDYEKMLAGAPPQLAELHAQANQLIDGGLSAFDERIKGLDGFPVVVNVWASWCVPCRAEFPHFQDAAAKLGKKVAFLGVDSDDDADAAATFLESNPVPYPIYSDPDKEIAARLNAPKAIPATAFIDEQGELVYTKLGPYRDSAELEADIERYSKLDGENQPAGS
ncbi:MAG: TlpA family protein disulfide reductase [Actinomycetota bacterium]|nr:TlpA family protein disulfide reductase [Actinomycetota bacterium]